MRRMRFPLFAKIIVWLVLNIALVGPLSYVFAARDQSGWNMLLTQSVRDRVTSIARRVGEDVYSAEGSAAAAALEADSKLYGAELNVQVIGGPPRHTDDDGLRRGPLPDRPPPPDRMPGAPQAGRDGLAHSPWGPGFNDGPGPPRGSPPGSRSWHMEIRRATHRTGFDVITDISVAGNGGPPNDLRVAAHTGSLTGLFQFLGLWSALSFVLMILLVSVLLWWPFVWSMTRSIRRLLNATQHMARGRLDTRVSERRRDELGELASAVNSMAGRLQDYLQGQRQFVADVAHEVISPVARIQIGLGLLETQVTVGGAATLADIREDLEDMAGMLNEILLFSRSGFESERSAPQRVNLADIVQKVIAAEAGSCTVVASVSKDILVIAHVSMIERALANLVRNACRYAYQDATPIEISARNVTDQVLLTVQDRGPGVPDSALARLGQPFFRPELSRSRASGGFGLGLAIVRRCIAACGGEVTFRNRQGGGFEAELQLKA